MLNERRLAVDTVAAAFLPTERAAEQTAILGARCIAAMIEQRVAAGLPLDTGAEAFALVTDATFHALGRQKLRAGRTGGRTTLGSEPVDVTGAI